MAQEQKIDFEALPDQIDFEPIQPKKEETGLLDRVLSGLHSVDQFLTPEPFKDKPPGFVGPINQGPLGPGFNQIPGVQSAADWLANKIDNPLGEGGYIRGGIAGAIQGLGGLLASGADPRAVGIKPNAPLPQIFEGPLPEVRQVGSRGLLERSNPTGPDIRSGGTRFLGGESGVSEVGRTYPIDTGPVNPSMMGTEPTGTILQRELGDINQIPADQAARTGLTLGRPISPELERPPTPVIPERKLLTRGENPPDEIRLPSETWQDRLGNIDFEPQEMRVKNYYENNSKQRKEMINRVKELNQQISDAYSNKDINKVADLSRDRDDIIYALGGHRPGSSDIPDFAEIPREPQMMRTPQGGIAAGGADPRVLQVLGSSLYSNDRPSVVVKELLQNSFDEHRIIGSTAPIHILFSHETADPLGNKAVGITVRDQGRGLTPEELYTVFTDVGKTGKGGEESASGGFGFAKAAPLLSGQAVRVESTVRENGQLVRYAFEGTPEELINQKQGVPLGREVLTGDMKKVPTGLSVTTYFPPDTSVYAAKDLAKNIVKNSPTIKSPVKIADAYIPDYEENFHEMVEGRNDQYGPFNDLKAEKSEPMPPQQDVLETPGAQVALHFHDPQGNESSSYNLDMLNKGMFQGSTQGSYGWGNSLPNVPHRIVANIISKVEEGHPEYPFTANREQISKGVKNAISKWVQENIISGAQKSRIASLQKMYDGIQPLFPGINGVHILDEGARLSPEEITDLSQNEFLKNASGSLENVHNNILQVADSLGWMGNTKRSGNQALDALAAKLGQEQSPTVPSDKLEKFGLLFQAPDKGQTTLGIHIPSPASGGTKSAILVNLMEHLKRVQSSDDPLDQLASNLFVTLTHEIAHIPGGGHDEGHSYRQADLEGKLGARQTMTMLNALMSAFGDENGTGLNPEVQNLLSIYDASRGRESNASSDLIKTGVNIKRPVNSGGTKEGSSGSPKPSDPRIALNKLITSISEAKPLRAEQEESYSAERSERIRNYSKIRQKGLAGFTKALNRLRGPYEKVDASSIAQKMSTSEINSLIDFISAHKLPGFQDPRAKIALLKTINGELPQNNELDLLNRVFGSGLPDAILELHAGVPITRTALSETAGIAKSLKSSFDFSAPFRQGIALIHTPEFWHAFKDMFALAPSEISYRASQDALKDRPLADFSQKSGLYLADISDKNYSSKEEAYPSRMLSRGKYNPVGFSERAYTAFLNQLRANTFDKLVMEAGKNISDLKDMHEFGKQAAEFVNNATGRGSLDFSSGKKGSFGNFEKSAVELNAAFYSPRLMASRVRMLTKVLDPKFYTQLDPAVRKEYLKSLLAIGGFGTIMALAARQIPGLMGKQRADVSLNPTSADFGKIKFGPTRVDPYGGFQQYIVLVNKLVEGQSTSTTSGITREFGPGPISGSRYSTLDQFRRNKMSPLAAFGEDWLRGSNAIGEKFQAGPEVLNLFAPMVLQDAVELYKENPDYFWLIGPDALGAGLQTYGQKESGGLKPLGGVGKLKELSR